MVHSQQEQAQQEQAQQEQQQERHYAVPPHEAHLNLPARFYMDEDDEHPQEECGIFGVYNQHEQAATTTFFALHALQHRGQEMGGIATSDGREVNVHRGLGLVSQIFTEENTKALTGRLGVGHTRYSTAGGKSLSNAQPFVLETALGKVALAHNGQLTRQRFLRKLLLSRGTGLFTNSDSELIAQMLAHPATSMGVHSPLSPSMSPVSPYPNVTNPQSVVRPHTSSITAMGANGAAGAAGAGANAAGDDSSCGYSGVVAIHKHDSAATNNNDNNSNNGNTQQPSSQQSHLLDPRQAQQQQQRANERPDPWIRRMADFMVDAEGAFALCVLVRGAIYGCRDRFGIRPLCLGEKKHNDGTSSWALASESCGFGPIGFQYVREVAPGEIVRLDRNGVHSEVALPQQAAITPALCIFEYVYFARPDTLLEEQLVHSVRQKYGKVLAEESHIDADIVAGVPDSSIAAAIGYSMQSKIPFMEVLCKNRYIGRTFIQPDQAMRENSIRLKFNPLTQNLKDKRVILVDDSLVRGNTLKQLIPLLKNAGASHVHIRISSPVLRHPCYMGVDIGTYDEILASHLKSVESMRAFIGADSLAFLSHEGMLRATREGARRHVPSSSPVVHIPPAAHPPAAVSASSSPVTAGARALLAQQHAADKAAAAASAAASLSTSASLPSSSAPSHELNQGYCSACFTGTYPVQLDIEDQAHSMNRGHC